MKSTPITGYNKKALIDISKTIEFNDWEKQPVKQIITYGDFNDIGITIKILLDAIEMIGFNGNETDLATCAGLAQIANKIIPLNELNFLDDLLVKRQNYEGEKIEFTPLNK
jgi:hypothetical protein